jgi:hypothetical protein
MIGRRDFITLLGGASVARPLALRAQPTTPVIGFLDSDTPAERSYHVSAFRQGLNDAGFFEGRNLRSNIAGRKVVSTASQRSQLIW